MPELNENCKDCGNPFVITEEEQKFYKMKGFTFPKRCKACRTKRKLAKQAEGGGI